MDGYKPGAECAECKGRCCREKGCSLSPADMSGALRKFTEPDTALKQCAEVVAPSMEAPSMEQSSAELPSLREQFLALLTAPDSLYAIDCFQEKTGTFYYLRMRHKCYTFIGVDAIGECIALTKDGCSLAESERPKGGRFLESVPNRQCIQHYTREEMLTDWAPFQEALASIWQEYYEQFIADGTFDKCDDAYFAWMRAQREIK